jgi:predicted ribosome quality control (RQC) complex YloA/Tae2 family protein
MHLNFHFLQYLSPVLSSEFKGKTITECFSQSKDELIIHTSDEQSERFIRAHFLPPQIYYSFPGQFSRAKRNSINLFPEIIGETIQSCQVLQFERAFYFEMESKGILLFKLHGNRSNVLWYPDGEETPEKIFRNEFQEDKTLNWKDLEKNPDLSKESFEALDGNASKYLPTLGKVPREWLKNQGYIAATLTEKWELMQDLVDMLSTPLFTLAEKEGDVFLSLLPEQNPIKTFSNPLEAVNELFYKAMVVGNFEKEKKQLLKKYGDELKKTENYITKSRQKLEDLQNAQPPSQIADVIMANLHKFNASQREYELEDFYTGKTLNINLKPNQKATDLAENLYRKNKNRQIEVDQITQAIQSKENKQLELEEKILELESMDGFRDLKDFKKNHKEDKALQKEQINLPFRQFELQGFSIWVGKSAKDNDEMLRHYIHKDDLWLHARQVAGSHVVIRNKGKANIPNFVLERAASLAAFYSKLKSDSLAPVIYTEAKFVRKVKGLAPGAVMVDKEKVIQVPPQGPSEDIIS